MSDPEDICKPNDPDGMTLDDVLEFLEEAAFQDDIDNPYVPLNFNDED